MTVLMTAVATDHGDQAMVGALIAKGADLTVKCMTFSVDT